jgi:hypothetical protein
MCRHHARVQKPANAFTDSSSLVEAVKGSVVKASNCQIVKQASRRQSVAWRSPASVVRLRGRKGQDLRTLSSRTQDSGCTIAGLFLMVIPRDHSLVWGARLRGGQAPSAGRSCRRQCGFKGGSHVLRQGFHALDDEWAAILPMGSEVCQ